MPDPFRTPGQRPPAPPEPLPLGGTPNIIQPAPLGCGDRMFINEAREATDRASAERVALAIRVRAEVVAWLRSAPNAVLCLPRASPEEVLRRSVHLPQFVWDAIAYAIERGETNKAGAGGAQAPQEPRSGGEGDA